MLDYQQRVVDEQRDLDEKRQKLNVFIRTEMYRALPQDERDRLANQSMVMYQYSRILTQRIAAF